MEIGWSLKRAFSKAEVAKLKVDQAARDRIKADIEERMQIGKPQPIPVEAEGVFWPMATQEATAYEIRKFCNALGDPNPLYRDHNYARNTIYGGIIAPPHFVWAVCSPFGEAAWGMRPPYATSAFNTGTRTEWFKVIHEGDRFSCTDVPAEAKDCTREETAVQFLCRTDRIYRNQRGEVVCKCNHSIMYVVNPRKDPFHGRELARARKPSGKRWTEAELEEVERLYDSEEIQGSDPRFWEDVKIGDQMKPTYQLFTLLTSVSLICGMNQFASDWRFVRKIQKRFNSWFISDPDTGIPDVDLGLHLSDHLAQVEGVAGFVAQGCYLDLWPGRLITTWIGDLGFLKKIETQNRKFLPRGSLAVCKGEVVKKYIEGGEHLVDLRIRLEDQDGVLSVPGSATVVLPSRDTFYDYPPFGTTRKGSATP